MKTIRINLAGKIFTLNIESLHGRYRIKDGQARRYAADYGEIADTKGADGDPVDVYWGGLPDVSEAFVINQYRTDGSFDEHKVMLGFFDREQAARAYQISTGFEPDIYACTPAQLAWWLAHGNLKKPVTRQSFPFDAEQETMPHTDIWTENLSDSAAKLLYGWRKTDTGEELLEAATMDALLQTEVENGAQIDEAAFDALAVPSKKLERTAQIVGVSLNRAAESLKVAEDGIHISKPMKQNGTTNVVVMFEITDGQTVSVFFHNPDTTPQKLAPDDVLVSWKWLLNRKDITIAVAKENGRDLQIQQVARRVMALVEKNTARFAKANAARAERIANLQKMEAEIAEKEALVEELSAQLAAKTADMAAENPDSAPTETPAPTGGSLNTEPLDESSLQPLTVPENATAKEVRKALEGYLQQLQGKTVTTSDGKTVRFSRKSTKHIANDATVKKMILPQAVVHVVDVLKTGEFVDREPAYKERSDFVAFHAYRKWIGLPDKEVLMQVKAAELPNGELEAGDGLLAYSAKDVGDKTKEADDTASFVTDGAFGTSGNPSINPSVASSTTGTSAVPRGSNDNAAYDSVQDEAYIFIEILEVRDKQGGNAAADVPSADGGNPSAKHYSEEIIDALVRNHGWAYAEHHSAETPAAMKSYHDDDKAGQVNPDGQFIVFAAFRTPENRYLELQSGFETVADMDCRDLGLAQEFEQAAAEFDKKYQAWRGESAAYSADNPYAAYAGDDEEASRNADDWEAREPLTEAVLGQLNEKAEQQGFTTLVETRHASLGRFQAVKESGQMQVLIDGEFKNHGSSSVYEAAHDFTVTLKDSGEVMDYFYTNDIDAALQKARGWLDKAGNLQQDGQKESEQGFQETPEAENAANPAPPDDARAYLQAVIDGKTDVLAGGFDDEFLAFVERHEQDESLRGLLEQAVSVWQQAALQASENIK